MSIYADRLKNLQSLMKKNSLNLFIIPSFDIHLSEYPAKCFLDRVFISGFTGSAGTLLIFLDEAFLLTDGRYELQAKKELQGSNIKLMVSNDYLSFLNSKLKKTSSVGIDFKKISLSQARELKAILKAKKSSLKDINLVNSLWSDRPPLPNASVFEHKSNFCSDSRENKLARLREALKTYNANASFISSLDDIAYITNLRGLDVSYNPVFLSFFFIDEKEAILFIDEKKISFKLKDKLNADGITVRAYEDFENFILGKKNLKLLLDASKNSLYIAKLFKKQKNKIIKATNPSTIFKSCKNEKEIKHIKEAMIQDGVALCEFFIWFEKSLRKSISLSELDIAKKLSEFRARHRLYICDSFSTISAFNENAALPHYKASENSFSYIRGDGLLLIDSGAQYQNGTTDITRVLPVNKIKKEHKKDYTIVLKSLIAMSVAKFPKDISLVLIDSIARSKMWNEGLDYNHGTGHGVGYFLNVHEAPVVLSYYAKMNEDNRAKIGVLSSIEPGIYKEGKWGIRLENLAYIAQDSKLGNFAYFQTLSLCPFEKKLIDKKMLDKDELAWLNSYHELVYKNLSPHFKGYALKWLRQKTSVF